MKVLEHPLQAISARARPYPAYLLPNGGTALALFSAAYLGHNDAIHFARAEMQTTCVDVDRTRLHDMSFLYPRDWEFVYADAWDYAQDCRDRDRQWDVVTVDTFTGDATVRSLTTLDLWCSLARSLVTTTIVIGQEYETPEGWTDSLFPRSDRAAWLVLQCQ